MSTTLKATGWNSGPEGQSLNATVRENRDKGIRDDFTVDPILSVAGRLQPAAHDLAAGDGSLHTHIPPNPAPNTGTFDHGDPANHAYTPLTRRAASPGRHADPCR